MKVFFAGAESFMDVIEDVGNLDILINPIYAREYNRFRDYKKRNKGAEIFLDSGGYTFRAKYKTDTVTPEYLKSYVELIKSHPGLFDHYANVDVLGAKNTLINQTYLEKHGLNPIPVYHVGEPEEYLKAYCKKYPLVALGGLVPIKGAIRREIVMKVVGWINKHYPEVKLHLFGVTEVGILDMIYPWIFSVDSTSWLAGSRFGSLQIGNKARNFKEFGKKPYYRKAVKMGILTMLAKMKKWSCD